MAKSTKRKPARKKIKAYKAERVFVDVEKMHELGNARKPFAVVIRGMLFSIEGPGTYDGPRVRYLFTLNDGTALEVFATVRPNA